MPNLEIARVHLPVLGRVQAFEVPFVPGKTTLTESLGAARSLAAQALTAAAQVTGHEPTCRAGCAACCRHLVMLTIPEALALAGALQSLPEPRRGEVKRRIAAALRKAEAGGIFGPAGARRFLVAADQDEADVEGDVARRYFALGIACPFLEREACTVYELRPLACREHNVSSDPKHCHSFDHAKRRGVPSLGLARAVALATDELSGLGRAGVPLPVLLEWYATQPSDSDREVDGVAALRALLEALGEVEER